MNPRPLGLLSALGATLALSSCMSSSTDYDNHWNPGSLGRRTQYHFYGYRGERDGSYAKFTESSTKHVVRSFRRHFLNDNPTNPYQRDIRWGGESEYSIWLVESHVLAIGREAALGVWHGLGIAFWAPIDIAFGTVADMTGLGYDESFRSRVTTGISDSDEPTDPEDFEVKHKTL